MSFRPVFIAVIVATGLVVAGYIVNAYRPRGVTDQPSAAFVRASGKCAECHSNLQYSVVHEYEMMLTPRSTSTVWSAIGRSANRRGRSITASSSARH